MAEKKEAKDVVAEPLLVVLLREVWSEGVAIPKGTVLDANTEWVARCVVPYGLCEPKTVADKRVALEAEIARLNAEAKGA